MCIRDSCSIFEHQVVSTPFILLARSLVKPDRTGNVPVKSGEYIIPSCHFIKQYTPR